MIRILLLALSYLLPFTTVADCPHNADLLGAEYHIVVQTDDVDQPVNQTLTLWRNGARVLHVHPQRSQSELWEYTIDNRLRLVRLFDEYEQGIEYQPGEFESIDGSDGWQVKRQLLAPRVLDSERLESSAGEGCAITQTYAWEESGVRYILEWLPAWQLVVSYTMESERQSVIWTLENRWDEAAVVNQVFARVDDYNLTDFTDIGDNESDPFLQQKIRMGFVEHPHGPNSSHD